MIAQNVLPDAAHNKAANFVAKAFLSRFGHGKTNALRRINTRRVEDPEGYVLRGAAAMAG